MSIDIPSYFTEVSETAFDLVCSERDYKRMNFSNGSEYIDKKTREMFAAKTTDGKFFIHNSLFVNLNE